MLGETRERADASARSVVPDPAKLAGTYTRPRLVSSLATPRMSHINHNRTRKPRFKFV